MRRLKDYKMLEDHLGVYFKTVRTAEALTKVMSENAEPLEALANPMEFLARIILRLWAMCAFTSSH